MKKYSLWTVFTTMYKSYTLEHTVCKHSCKESQHMNTCMSHFHTHPVHTFRNAVINKCNRIHLFFSDRLSFLPSTKSNYKTLPANWVPAKYPLHTTWERERESEGVKARELSLETVDKKKKTEGEKEKRERTREKAGGREWGRWTMWKSLNHFK